jgi:CRP/FNR family transcriptional regulator
MSPGTQIRPRAEAVIPRQAELPGGVRRLEISNATCSLRETCLSEGLPAGDLERFDNIAFTRRLIRRGERLFDAGSKFRSIYAVRSGFFKTNLIDVDGREQVTGFFMSREILGMDGLGSGRYAGSAISLEDSDVCVVPYSLIEEMGREVPSLQRLLYSVLAREVTRGHGIMLLLGSMSGQQRLAAFLINLSRRFQRRGYSGSRFILRMTRDEIGSYLGLKLETVSRLFSAFHRDGLIDVQLKEVAIIDIKGLERVLAR